MKIATIKMDKTAQAQTTLIARATQYNDLPKEITLIANKKFFTKKLKTYLRDNTKIPDMANMKIYYNKPKTDNQLSI